MDTSLAPHGSSIPAGTAAGQRAAQVAILIVTPLLVAGLFHWGPGLLVSVRRGDPSAMIVALVAVFAALVLTWHTVSLLAAYVAILEGAPAFLRHLLRGLVQHVGTGQARDLLYRHTAATAMATSMLTGVVPGALAMEPAMEPAMTTVGTEVGTEVSTTWDVPDDLAWGGPPAAPAPATHSPEVYFSPSAQPSQSSQPSQISQSGPSSQSGRLGQPVQNSQSSQPSWFSQITQTARPSPTVSTSTPAPVASPVDVSAPPVTSTSAPSTNATHVVKPGESLWSIGFQLTGSDTGAATVWPQIYELNQELIGPNPSLIRPGLELNMPQVKP